MGDLLCENCLRPEREHFGEQKACVPAETSDPAERAQQWTPMTRMYVDLKLNHTTGEATLIVSVNSDVWHTPFKNEAAARAAVEQIREIARSTGASRIVETLQGSAWLKGQSAASFNHDDARRQSPVRD